MSLDDVAIDLFMQSVLASFNAPRGSTAIYVGIDLITGSKLYWNLSDSRNLNVLAVGPSGSGKTLSLACLAHRLARSLGTSLLAIDVKGEYLELLRGFYGMSVRVVDPLVTRLNVCSAADPIIAAVRAVFGERLASSYSYALRISCESREPLSKIVHEYADNVDLVRFSECFSCDSPIDARALLDTPTVVCLSSLFRTCPRCVPAMYVFLVELAMLSEKKRDTVLIVDEAWNLAKYISPRDLSTYLRLARGRGVALFIATQSLDDVSDASVLIENSSLSMIFASDPVFLSRVSRYVKLPRDLLEEASRVLGVGECIAKIPGVSGYRLCYFDPTPNA